MRIYNCIISKIYIYTWEYITVLEREREYFPYLKIKGVFVYFLYFVFWTKSCMLSYGLDRSKFILSNLLLFILSILISSPVSYSLIVVDNDNDMTSNNNTYVPTNMWRIGRLDLLYSMYLWVVLTLFIFINCSCSFLFLIIGLFFYMNYWSILYIRVCLTYNICNIAHVKVTKSSIFSLKTNNYWLKVTYLI